MTWKEYKRWLEANIIEEIEKENKEDNDDMSFGLFDDNKEEEDNSPTPSWKLREGVADKYELGNLFGLDTGVAKALANLCLSIEHNGDTVETGQYSNHHPIPSVISLEVDDLKKKSWAEIFPTGQANFGKINEKKVCEGIIFETLGKIFEDWRQEENRANKLEEEINGDKVTNEIFLRANIHIMRDLLKQDNYEQRWINWLAEYNRLGTEKQERLKRGKEDVEQILAWVRAEFKLSQEQASKSWWQNCNWKTIGLYGGGLVLLIILIWLWKKAFK